MQTFLILGNHPEIALLEAETVLGKTSDSLHGHAALFSGIESHPEFIVGKLAGVIKTGAIIDHVREFSKDNIAEFLASLLMSDGEKVRFGISVYDGENTALADKMLEQYDAIGMSIKSLLKEQGISSRFVISKNAQLSAADIVKNQILDRGAEFVLITTEYGIAIGQTNGVQRFEDWSHRDFDRPARDAKRGMLPPKLARTMINLAGSNPETSTILDPFCGVGTVLAEAALLGFSKIIGSDIDPKAIKDTRKNLNWLTKNYDIHPHIELFESRAQNISAHIPKSSIDCIVFEPFLGNPRKGHESRDDLQKMKGVLEHLYRESLKSLRELMKDDGRIIAAIPVHYFENEPMRLQMDSLVHELGFTYVHEPMHYRQKHQFVGRDITILKRI